MVVTHWAMKPLPVSPAALVAALGGQSDEALAIHLLAHALQAHGHEYELDLLTARAWRCLQDEGIL